MTRDKQSKVTDNDSIDSGDDREGGMRKENWVGGLG